MRRYYSPSSKILVVPIMTLNQQFIDLGNATRELIGLLSEADERFWVMCMQRALPKIEDHELAGATLVLGCFGGIDTFSDLQLRKELIDSDPVQPGASLHDKLGRRPRVTGSIKGEIRWSYGQLLRQTAGKLAL